MYVSEANRVHTPGAVHSLDCNRRMPKMEHGRSRTSHALASREVFQGPPSGSESQRESVCREMPSFCAVRSLFPPQSSRTLVT